MIIENNKQGTMEIRSAGHIVHIVQFKDGTTTVYADGVPVFSGGKNWKSYHRVLTDDEVQKLYEARDKFD